MFLYLTLYMQEVLGYSPLQAGIRFLPMSLLAFVANQYEVMKKNVFGYQHVATGSNIFLRESYFG